MSQRPASPAHDGRINLEQQRKRAKELLQRLKVAKTAPGQARATPRLSDAQWQIAKQLGFSSWPRLKAHVEAIDFAARHPGFEASDEARTTHWRCGNDIAHSLHLAGFSGRLRILTDPLCMGPVQPLPAGDYRASRCRFISQAFALDPADVARRLDDEYHHLAALGGAEHSVLWCEADAYDQLFLIRALAGLEHVPARLELIEVDRIPGVPRFIGIGQLAPELLAWLWPQRRRVDEPMLRYARRAWSAYCAPSPLPLAELAREPDTALPLLAAALRRQLQELPGTGDGLSLSERLSLRYIAGAGPVAFARVFAELMGKLEPLPYLGDLMFHALLRPLIDGPQPLLTESDPDLPWPRRMLTLTRLGAAVLAGAAYWPDHAHQERWVGGVPVVPGQPHWAIDPDGLPVWRA